VASLILVASFGSQGAFFTNAALAVAGAVVDRTLLFPSLFPQAAQEGQRIDDWAIGQSFEGAPAGWVDGTARIEGVPIYLGTPIEEQVTVGGGKAGPDSTSFLYRRDYVVLFSTDALPAGGYPTDVWINGERVFQLSPDVEIVSTGISCQKGFVSAGGSVPGLGYHTMTLISYTGQADLTKLQVGQAIQVSGFTSVNNAINPGGPNLQDDAVVEQVFKAIDGSTRAVIRNNQKVGVAATVYDDEAAGPLVTLLQDLPQLIPDVAESIEFYTGAVGQVPDPYIESTVGTGQVPSYEGLICVRFGGLNVTRFGNGALAFQATVVAISPTNLGEHAQRLMTRAGIPKGLYDTFGMAGNFVGAVARGPQQVSALLGTALQATNNIASERDGMLVFERRPVLVKWAIPESALGAVEYGQELPASPFPIEDAGDLELPRAVTVQHMDPALEFQTGAPRKFAPPGSQGDEVRMSLRSWAMSRQDAEQVAWSAIWTSQTNRQAIRFALPPSWLQVQVGHLVTLPVPSGPPIKAIVTSRVRGANGVTQLEAVAEAPEVHLQQF
jgi:hypothetical protein